MTITLPLPDKRLSPNARCHWAIKAALNKRARLTARLKTLSDGEFYLRLSGRFPDYTGYHLAFYWPDARRRDDDNAMASTKAYRDGIADALGIDDHALRMSGVPTFVIDRDNPRLEITLTK